MDKPESYIGVESAANQLNISLSTMKKYYLLIEEKGYSFSRSVSGKLLFSRDDLMVIRKVLELKNQPKMTVNKAIEQVIEVITGAKDNSPDEVGEGSKVITVMAEEVTEIKRMLRHQQEVISNQNKKLERISEDNRYYQNLLEYKDNEKESHDETVKKALKETQELKEMIRDLQEQQDKKWWKFW